MANTSVGLYVETSGCRLAVFPRAAGFRVERVDIYVLCLYLGYDCPGRRVEGLYHNKKSICIRSYKKNV
jgi:hypothetical protein